MLVRTLKGREFNMIESIYNNEGESGQDTRTNSYLHRMPKNIRQIGQVDGSKRIYIEDYVMTYIKQLAMKNYGKYQVAILLGELVKQEETKNIFIHGAVEVKNVEYGEQLIFSNEVWTGIYESIKKHFADAEIVGWYLTRPGLMLELNDKITKVHLDNFAGQDKTLLLYDSMEREEVFYSYENSGLKRQSGYYIYYDKNEQMQNYMVENKEIPSIEAEYDDHISREIRTVLANKKHMDDPLRLKILYGASTALAVIVLVIGVSTLSNYDKVKNLQSTLNVITENLNQVGEDATNATNDTKTGDDSSGTVETSSNAVVSPTPTTEVETIKGNVKTITNEEIVIEDTDPEESNETKNSDGKKPNETNKNDSSNANKKSSNKTTTASASNKSTKNTVKYYTVKKGDSLASISKAFYNTTSKIEDIKAANKIEDEDKIIIGQKLIMP